MTFSRRGFMKLGLVANRILYSRKGWAGRAGILGAIAAGCFALAAAVFLWNMSFLGPLARIKGGLLVGLGLVGLVTLAKFIMKLT